MAALADQGPDVVDLARGSQRDVLLDGGLALGFGGGLGGLGGLLLGLCCGALVAGDLRGLRGLDSGGLVVAVLGQCAGTVAVVDVPAGLVDEHAAPGALLVVLGDVVVGGDLDVAEVVGLVVGAVDGGGGVGHFFFPLSFVLT